MIAQIALQNFKVFRALNLQLGRLTLLSGLNSSGKSSILQALALLRQSHLAGTQGRSLMLNGELVDLGTGKDILNENAERAEIAIGLTAPSGDAAHWRANVDSAADVLRLSDTPPYIPAEIDGALFGEAFQYLQANRMTPAVIYPKSHESAVLHKSLGSRGEFTGHFLQYFRDEPVANQCLVREGALKLLSACEVWMAEISPEVRIEAEDLDGTDFVRLRFGFGRAAGISGSRSYRPTHVGFGLSYTLPIVVACLGTKPGGLIALENPEAHVHPRGQAALGRLLALAAAGGLQVLVETHSDHVLNGIRVAVKSGAINPDDVWLHFFRRTSTLGDVEIESPVLGRDGALSRWPTDFFDQWDRSLDELLD